MEPQTGSNGLGFLMMARHDRKDERRMLVELKVPSLGTEYSIRVDAHRKAETALEEMLCLVRQKTGEPDDGAQGYDLFSLPGGNRLKMDLPLGEQGIGDGSTLILM